MRPGGPVELPPPESVSSSEEEDIDGVAYALACAGLAPPPPEELGYTAQAGRPLSAADKRRQARERQERERETAEKHLQRLRLGREQKHRGALAEEQADRRASRAEQQRRREMRVTRANRGSGVSGVKLDAAAAREEITKGVARMTAKANA